MRECLKGLAPVVALVALGVGGCGSDDGGGTVDAGLCGPVEVAIEGVPEVGNPFDPALVDVAVTFRGPGGAMVTTPGFFSRSYERSLVGGFEKLNPTDAGRWYARFTPPGHGTWRWSASVRVGDEAPMEVSGSDVTCETDPVSHGVLQRSDADPHALVWEDGTPYVAIGENLCWYDGRGTFSYDVWLDKLAEHKANWIRLWMPSWAFGLEWIRRDGNGAVIETTLGNYGARLDRAWQLDYVIEAARQRGMAVMLAIQYHGAFSLTNNTEWDDNPYNAVNGGPLSRPHEFYTNAEARDLFERRLRYIVARWGYAPNLIWEFWNEVDLADPQPMEDVIEWHGAMGRTLRSLDPYGHLITTSISLQYGAGAFLPRWVPLWNLAEIDLAQIHFYGIGNLFQADFSTILPEVTQALRAATGKPVLVGEAGVDFRGPAETLAADPDHRGLHDLIWSGLFSGGFGTGMTWWWDNLVDPQNQYVQLDGIQRLTDGIAWDREGFVPDASAVTLAPDGALRALPLIGRDTVLVWLRNADHTWFQPNPTVITGATVQVNSAAAGRWRATWMDPRTGDIVAEDATESGDAGVLVSVPQFVGEIALRLEQE